MKRLLAVASVMLATCTVSFAQGSVDKAVIDLERQWVKAALSGKAEAMAPLLAPDFVSIQADATMQTKAEYVAMTSKSKWQVCDVSDMKAQVHGDSAVVIGVWTGKGTDATGKAVDTKERFADTWVKMADGKVAVCRERQYLDQVGQITTVFLQNSARSKGRPLWLVRPGHDLHQRDRRATESEPEHGLARVASSQGVGCRCSSPISGPKQESVLPRPPAAPRPT